jgi:hypothetical protein
LNDRDLYRLWQSAYALEAAWFQLGDEYQKNQFRNKRDRGQDTDYLEWDMKQNLLYSVFNEQLIALGLCIAPEKSEILRIIDPVHFDQPEVDWDKSEIRHGPWHFMKVHVRRYEQARIDEAGGSTADDTNEKADDATPPVDSSHGAEGHAARKRGRPPIIPELRDLIREIGPSKLDGLSPMQRISLIRAEFKRLHSGRVPAENTVRRAFREEGYPTNPAQKMQKI